MNFRIEPKPFSLSVIVCMWTVIIAYGVYAASMIFSSSTVIDGQRWFCLLDDGMISMRYARNLASGLGLVWNAGERVEGITNPGWTFIMALVHLIEQNRAYTSLYIQVLSAFCLILTMWFTGRLAWILSGGSGVASVLTAAITGFYYPLNYFSLYGMETGIVALLIVVSVTSYIHRSVRQRFPWPTYLILGITTLIRIDVVVPLLVIGFFGIVTSSDSKTRFRHGLCLVSTLLLFVGGQTAARLAYYGLPFPNTYYLKMTGFPVIQRVARGFLVTTDSLRVLIWPLYLLLVLAFGLRLKSLRVSNQLFMGTLRSLIPARKHWFVFLPWFIFCGQAAYSIYVGGDAWEENIHCNRYLVIAAPMLFTTVVLVAHWLLIGLRNIHGFKRVSYNWLMGIIGCFYLILINIFSVYPTMRDQLFPVANPSVQAESETSILTAQRIMAETKPDAVISCDWAGAVPYFIDRYAVDPLGKCDAHISHMEIPRSHWSSRYWNHAFYPGHMKWDAEYTWSTYHPDVMVFFWGGRIGVAFKSVLADHYTNESVDGIGGAYFVRK